MDFDLDLHAAPLWTVVTCLLASVQTSSFSTTPQCVSGGVLPLCCVQGMPSEHSSAWVLLNLT